MTVLVPSNDAVEDFRHDLEQINSVDGAEVSVVSIGGGGQNGGQDGGQDGGGSVQYSVDDGLTRKKRSSENDAPDLEDLLKNHVLDGLFDSSELRDEDVVATKADGSSVRITVYDTYPQKTVMANCAKVTSIDHVTTRYLANIKKRSYF